MKCITVLLAFTVLFVFAAEIKSQNISAVTINLFEDGTIAVCGHEISASTSQKVLAELFGEPFVRKGRNDDMLVFPKGGISLLVSKDTTAKETSLTCLLQAGAFRDKEVVPFHGLLKIYGYELQINGNKTVTGSDVQLVFKDLKLKSESFGPSLSITTHAAIVEFGLDDKGNVQSIVLSFIPAPKGA